MKAPIPQTPEALTQDWLAEVLEEPPAGPVSVRRIGAAQGFSGARIYRLELSKRRRLIAKLGPRDPDLRETFASANQREVALYAQLTDTPALAPACHHAAFDPDTGASVLLLEHLGTSPANIDIGCGLRDAKRVVTSLAALHARYWDQIPSLPGPDPLARFDFATAWAQYPARLAQLLPGTVPSARLRALGDIIAAKGPGTSAISPPTLLHRDPQLDNIAFLPEGAVRLIDWQFCGEGPGAQDLGYFLISSLTPSDRRAHQAGLIAIYHDALCRAGVTGYSLADCHREVSMGLRAKLWLTALATTLMDNEGAEKRRWRATDLARIEAACEDHQTTLDPVSRSVSLMT